MLHVFVLRLHLAGVVAVGPHRHVVVLAALVHEPALGVKEALLLEALGHERLRPRRVLAEDHLRGREGQLLAEVGGEPVALVADGGHRR